MILPQRASGEGREACCIGKLTPHHVTLAAIMRFPKLAFIFMFVGCLVVYLTYVKRHYDDSKPPVSDQLPQHRMDTHKQSTSAQVVSENFQYGIMLDAGSTGTRIHIFKFQIEPNEAAKLAHETFRAIKPGLSAYADDPEKSKEGLLELLKVAKDTVPDRLWSSSPLMLRATAGLRLLPGEKATILLDKVREVFSESLFLYRPDSVSIMDGTDEGMSAWITINFLLGGLHGSETPTVGMLDLGGGSTQITLALQDEKTIQTLPIDYVTSFQMFNISHALYSHSYLGLGLMSTRLAVLGGFEGQPSGPQELVSPCLAPDYSGQWEHAEVLYTVKGQKAGEPIYETCLTKVEKMIYKRVRKIEGVKDMDFYAFSYYYDRAVDLGLIDESTGGTVRVSDYIEGAKKVCNNMSAGGIKESPFLCLDLTYISVLLQELDFPPDKELKLARQINNVETSWALGATFYCIESLHKHGTC
ncbi:ectonucleoside triphosphate diphosphohydrolase 6-like isoform X2 [Sinocyclocheilus anshuiensis]|uniref:ectonucleoside triphosphate diphosphohydrolase 6-like isoform X2 n=1 Tax=Sinocyclocheilus anshuiensis TaxID=1608454 RepID=UPI0007BACBD4|nr:PREDICTED: ectonucleoside triphosphate diphosphohydrolase 6-like isoform X2 [Sinocyclocheilus anshuiensis]